MRILAWLLILAGIFTAPEGFGLLFLVVGIFILKNS